MIEWRDIRSQSELDDWIEYFQGLKQAAQNRITSEMTEFLDGYKGFTEEAVLPRDLKRLRDPSVGSPQSTVRPKRRRRPRA